MTGPKPFWHQTLANTSQKALDTSNGGLRVENVFDERLFYLARYVTLEHPVKGVRKSGAGRCPLFGRSVTRCLISPLGIRAGGGLRYVLEGGRDRRSNALCVTRTPKVLLGDGRLDVVSR